MQMYDCTCIWTSMKKKVKSRTVMMQWGLIQGTFKILNMCLIYIQTDVIVNKFECVSFQKLMQCWLGHAMCF